MIHNLRGRCPGGLLMWTGRWRGWGFSQTSPVQSPTPTNAPLSGRRGRGRALAPPSPPPLEDHPLAVRARSAKKAFKTSPYPTPMPTAPWQVP